MLYIIYYILYIIYYILYYILYIIYYIIYIVSPVAVSAIFVFPSHKNNVYMLSKVYCYFVWERKFLAVRRVGLMTHREYRVDRPFPVT